MWKILKVCTIVVLVFVLLEGIGLIEDKANLQENLVRLHVVANSDSQEDQTVKLQVKDAVVTYLEPLMKHMTDKEQAMVFLQEKLADLEVLANSVLLESGSTDSAKVSLKKEAFDTRVYETFSLPAGVYDSLRIEIGDGTGKNWWCVVFPSLCLPASVEGMQAQAVSAGFDDELILTLTHDEDYEIRFLLLECLGSVENFLFKE